MQFILDHQAKAEARWQRADERMDKFERSLGGIRKLVQTCTKMLVRGAEESREMQAGIRALTAAQQRTDRKFERLVDLLSRKSSNGRH